MSISKQLYELGEDAFSNLFKAFFLKSPKRVDLSKGLEARIEKVSIPTFPANVVKRTFQNISVEIPIGRGELVHEFTFDLRVDKDYKFYRELLFWNDLLSSYTEKSLDYLSAIKGSIFVVQVTNIKGDFDKKNMWNFYDVYPKQITSIEYDSNTSEPIKVTVTLGFSYME